MLSNWRVCRYNIMMNKMYIIILFKCVCCRRAYVIFTACCAASPRPSSLPLIRYRWYDNGKCLWLCIFNTVDYDRGACLDIIIVNIRDHSIQHWTGHRRDGRVIRVKSIKFFRNFIFFNFCSIIIPDTVGKRQIARRLKNVTLRSAPAFDFRSRVGGKLYDFNTKINKCRLNYNGILYGIRK